MPTPHLTPVEPLLLVDTQYSGNAWKVRLLAGLLSIPLQRQTLSIVDGDLTQPEFARINPWRQVPVLRTYEGQWLAESIAILWYLAAGSKLLPNDTPAQADILRWLAFEQTQHMEFLAQPRLRVALRKTADVNDPKIVAFRSRGNAALQIMEAQLTQNLFIAGNRATIADISLFPYTRMAEQGGYSLDAYPAIQRWLTRIEALPGYTGLLD